LRENAMAAPVKENNRSIFPAGDERRMATRLKSFTEAWADPGGFETAVPCRVMDISMMGAKIDCHGGVLPENFVLHIGAAKHLARVVWRRQTLVGVVFQKGVQASRGGSRPAERR
jgi:hypothetical protein